MDKRLLKLIEEADAVVIGAGAGLSTAAGIEYSGKRFEKYFKEYIDKYGLTDMYSSGFYPFETEEERWAYWGKHIYHNRYAMGATKLYKRVYNLFKDKAHFVLTTNADHQFFLAGFQDDKIFAPQGDYGLLQCAKACHDKTYYNEELVTKLVCEQKDCKVPSELVPVCPNCGGHMEPHLRKDEYFVQNESWDIGQERYQSFINEYKDKNIVFFELGVGMNTPGIIKYPFWKLTYQMENAFYICLNYGDAWAPEEIKSRSLCLDVNIAEVL